MNEPDSLQESGYTESFSLAGIGSKKGDWDDSGDAHLRKYLGKYRGAVRNNVDPEGRGRLFVEAVDALSLFPSNWAMPCVPWGGLSMGTYIVPPINAGVWVEFEQGDPDKPIWTGCWWGNKLETPATASLATPAMPVMITETIGKNAMVISDTPIPPMLGPGLMLRAGPSYITIDPSGINIFGPKITVNGMLMVNNGALTVTL